MPCNIKEKKKKKKHEIIPDLKAPTMVLNRRLLTNIWKKEERIKAWGYDSK